MSQLRQIFCLNHWLQIQTLHLLLDIDCQWHKTKDSELMKSLRGCRKNVAEWGRSKTLKVLSESSRCAQQIAQFSTSWCAQKPLSDSSFCDDEHHLMSRFHHGSKPLRIVTKNEWVLTDGFNLPCQLHKLKGSGFHDQTLEPAFDYPEIRLATATPRQTQREI